MGLGSVMSLGGMPYHVVTDAHGDQVALPCTERNFSMDLHTAAVQRGYMPVLSAKGRDEVRLGSFNGVAGTELAGPWTGVPPPAPSPPKPEPAEAPAASDDDAETDADLLDLDVSDEDGLDLDLDLSDDDDGDDDLDALLAGFEDDGDGEDSGDMEDDLAALLADL